ncbi:hypothetical protein ENBRE01_2755 [Enteropsectra breve]|nr:hypothetical protein ENBRE01_2755 [Enteropsectra breve]
MKRHNLSLRRYTTFFKIPDSEIVAKAVSFKKFIENIGINQYDPEFVIAMDETAVYFGGETQTTIAARGSTSISVPSTGYESHRVTCILAIKRNGEKMMPLLITKGKRASIEISNGIMVLETENAWCT